MEKIINSVKSFNQKIIDLFNKKIIIYLYCLISSFIFLFICTKSSPFYSFNNWVDPNSFFTMGKGMANGLIIYKDLFEQKGPLLYLIHAIAYWISNDTFFGVFIFEVISFSIFLYFVGKIITIYFRKIHILWAIPLISYVILTSHVFIGGDSAEEFCLPLMAISLFNMLNYYKNTYPNKIETKHILIDGIMAGCVLCIKYNLLGFWLGYISILILGLLFNKKIKDAFLTGIYFLGGILITVIPWIIYFLVNNAFLDMFKVYFLVNITAYSNHTSIINRILNAFKDAWFWAKGFKIYVNITIIGYIYIMISKKIIPNVFGKIALTLSIIITIIGAYYGSNHVYYFLILWGFFIIGIILIAEILQKILRKYLNIMIIIAPIYFIIIVALTCHSSHNFSFHNTKKEDLVQYQFAEIILEKPNATLLNYGALDGGFYTVTGIVPNVKYFHEPNIKYENYPEIMDEQNRYIKEKIIDFVVIKVDTKEESYDIPNLYENYNMVKNVYVSDEDSYYMLFKINA